MTATSMPLVSEPRPAPRFLTAHWKDLVMLNYQVNPDVLIPWLPPGLEVDSWQGKTLLSVVGFRFEDTRLLGVAIPGHRDFQEVNLRFYVRRRVADGWRRGVVFLKELAPRWAIACVARWAYGERYTALPMDSLVWRRKGFGESEWMRIIRYQWCMEGTWEELYAEAKGEPMPVSPDSEAAFITDHLYGYSRCRGTTLEYLVEHPSWRVWEANEARLSCNVARLYGEPFTTSLKEPYSALVVEGSPVVVRWGRRVAG